MQYLRNAQIPLTYVLWAALPLPSVKHWIYDLWHMLLYRIRCSPTYICQIFCTPQKTNFNPSKSQRTHWENTLAWTTKFCKCTAGSVSVFILSKFWKEINNFINSFQSYFINKFFLSEVYSGVDCIELAFCKLGVFSGVKLFFSMFAISIEVSVNLCDCVLDFFNAYCMLVCFWTISLVILLLLLF